MTIPKKLGLFYDKSKIFSQLLPISMFAIIKPDKFDPSLAMLAFSLNNYLMLANYCTFKYLIDGWFGASGGRGWKISQNLSGRTRLE